MKDKYIKVRFIRPIIDDLMDFMAKIGDYYLCDNPIINKGCYYINKKKFDRYIKEYPNLRYEI